MAEAFKPQITAGVGLTETVLYTCPASTQAVCIGLIAANILGSDVKVTVRVKKGATYGNVIKNGNIPTGQSAPIIGSDAKIALEAGDQLLGTCDTASGLDFITSVMEVS